jgi:hypothetical protein
MKLNKIVLLFSLVLGLYGSNATIMQGELIAYSESSIEIREELLKCFQRNTDYSSKNICITTYNQKIKDLKNKHRDLIND